MLFHQILGSELAIIAAILSRVLLTGALHEDGFADFFDGFGGGRTKEKILEFLNAKPLLRLDFRLGEGTGAICAYPIVDSAVRMINEMNSFEKIMVTKYFD